MAVARSKLFLWVTSLTKSSSQIQSLAGTFLLAKHSTVLIFRTGNLFAHFLPVDSWYVAVEAVVTRALIRQTLNNPTIRAVPAFVKKKLARGLTGSQMRLISATN